MFNLTMLDIITALMSHIERRQREKEEVKSRIMLAAREIAKKDGWPAVTIRKIADAVEYTPPIVYEYFEGKEALIKELIYSGFEMLKGKIEQAEQATTSPKELLRLLSVIHWDFANENFDLYQLMFSLERVSPSKEMIYNMTLIERIFLQLAHGDETAGKDLLLYWACLNRGAVSALINSVPPPSMAYKSPRAHYLTIIDRFLDSI